MATRLCQRCGIAYKTWSSTQKRCFDCLNAKPVCGVCGKQYRPSYAAQQTCSISCANIIRNRRRKLHQSLADQVAASPTSFADAAGDNIDGAIVQTIQVEVTNLRRRLTWHQAMASKRCQTCRGPVVLEAEEDPGILATAKCLQCGREVGQVRRRTSIARVAEQAASVRQRSLL